MAAWCERKCYSLAFGEGCGGGLRSLVLLWVKGQPRRTGSLFLFSFFFFSDAANAFLPVGVDIFHIPVLAKTEL